LRKDLRKKLEWWGERRGKLTITALSHDFRVWDGSRGLVFAFSIDGSEQARNITDGVKN
jgi:hypothetical protein